MASPLAVDGFENAIMVGRGGFAEVYRAWQTAFNREVAIKVLSVRPSSDINERLRRECAAIGALSGHPNVVIVHEIGVSTTGEAYIVMEYLEGGSLADRLRAFGPFDWQSACLVGMQLCDALATSHRAGILHRDVKPENIFVSRFGQPKLGDFGIAQLFGSRSQSGTAIVGSVPHAAPEVLAGCAATVASDVYSLGSTLFTLLNGAPPFGIGRGDEPLAIVARIATEPVPDLRRRGVPDTLCCVVEQALAKEPAARQSGVEEMGRQLQTVLGGAGGAVLRLPSATPSPPLAPRRPTKWRRWSLALVALLPIAAAAVYSFRDGGKELRSSVGAPASGTALVTTTIPTLATRPPSVLADDFSQPVNEWRTLEDSTGDNSIGWANGKFRMAVAPSLPGARGSRPVAYIPLSEPPPRQVRMEIDVETTTGGAAAFGVLCGSEHTRFPYGALIDVNGTWELIRMQDGRPLVVIMSGSGHPAIRPSGPNHMSLDCTANDGAVLITFLVNNIELAHTKRALGDSSDGPGPGAIVLSGGAPTEVLFDDLVLTYS